MTTVHAPDLDTEERINTARIQFVSALSLGMCGQEAFTRVAAAVGRLEDIDPLELVRGANPHARRHMRFLCTIVGPQTPDEMLPEVVRSLVCNPHLPYELVKDVVEGTGCNGEGGEVPGRTLRLIAQALRAGHSQAIVAEMLDVSHKVVEQVSLFLDIPEAVEARLSSAALRLVVSGGTVADFQASEGVGRHTALRHMRSAREALSELREDGTLDELGWEE